MPVLAPITIAGLAKQSGVDAESIRTYQGAGLLPQPQRLESHHADATQRQRLLERLTFIWRAQKLGFSLEAIGRLLGLDGGLRTCDDIRRLTERHLAEVRARVPSEEISRLECALVPLLDACPRRGRATDCPIIDMLSHSS
jgi:MerR family mercuric resistance operon transcriptional regulator